MAQVTAKLNNFRIAPRKARAVAYLLRGMKVKDAASQLAHITRRVARPIEKLLKSAVSNAENNFSMVGDNLYVKRILVNEGTKLKRFRAKGFGRASPIEKKTSHILITLDEVVAGVKRQNLPEKQRPAEASSDEAKGAGAESKDKKIFAETKPEIKRRIGSRGNMLANFGKRLFRRKSI